MRFVQDDKGFVERSAAHERQGCYFNNVFLDKFHHLVKAEHFIQGIVQGSQVGIDFLHQVAGQIAQFFPGFHCRSHQDQASDPVLLQGKHRAGYCQVGFARAGWPDTETDVISPDIVQV